MGFSIATQTTRAAGLSAISNLIAQAISAKKNGTASLQFDVLFKYVLHSVLNTPLNCLWQDYLEQRFPSYETTKKPSVSTGERGGSDQSQNLANIAWKFLLDQTIGAAGNIIFFIAVSGFLNSFSLEQVVNSIAQDSLKIYSSGLMIWPLVSLISFAWVPASQRVLFGCVAGIFWGVYLSLVAIED